MKLYDLKKPGIRGIFITWEKHISHGNRKSQAHGSEWKLNVPLFERYLRYLLRNSNPYHPCMAYLPTFTIKTQPNEVNIPVPWILCERQGTWEVFGETHLHMHRPASLQLHLPMS